MKNLFILFCCTFLISSCDRVDLTQATSQDINTIVKSFKGKKVVLVNVWALWCLPCVEEFPMIVELGQDSKDLEVLFVSADFIDQSDQVHDFLGKQGVYDLSLIKNEKDEPFINGLHPDWSGTLPFTVVYSKLSGEIVDFWEGKEPETRFRSAIEKALRS
jgi:thiol-disulfide isomerase/thioredoxin|tara:strand:+ start:3932 stop:4411 length:480 start_codon:yes stop_codon:yes gene_type:complete